MCLLAQALVDTSITRITIFCRILHMSSKTLCNINRFVRTLCRTIISISLQGLKEVMVSPMASTIYSSRKSNVRDRDNMRNWWSAVSACSNRMITVAALVVPTTDLVI